MSGIWGWFGGGGSQRTNNAPKNAILGLRAQLDMLQKREAHLTNQIAEQDGIARKNVNTNKNSKLDLSWDILFVYLYRGR
jgi:charged multivesicular body protein 4